MMSNIIFLARIIFNSFSTFQDNKTLMEVETFCWTTGKIRTINNSIFKQKGTISSEFLISNSHKQWKLTQVNAMKNKGLFILVM